jgi:hemerythrin-like domain-containing protein
METFRMTKQYSEKVLANSRRKFLKKGFLLGAASGVASLGLITACNEEKELQISPAEDLMREHGVLNRILLIYDACIVKLTINESFDMVLLNNSAQIIRTFIEDYHEKLEEDFLFPRFLHANQMAGLIQELYIQHATGRKITDQILQFGKIQLPAGPDENQKLIKLLSDFNLMYRPHEAREDTVLFPAIRKIVSKNEYYALGEDFENKEHELFGSDGFESFVEKVASIENQLGIYNLSKFTPQY